MSKSKVLFLMTGSIACYKACSLISKLVQSHFDVQVVASPSALQFVGEATLEGLTGNRVFKEMYDSGKMMSHIHLIRDCDLVICAPATAHYINRIAQGIGDDLLSTLFLAHDFEKPFLIAPAMNTKMYLHPVTQTSIQKLRSFGVQILETASGVLACGEIGSGKLLDPDLIFEEIQKSISNRKSSSTKSVVPKDSKPVRVLVTAGGTSEPIDDVRVISNRSTGRTATQLAHLLNELGLEVTLCKAKSSQVQADVSHERNFETYEDLKLLLQNELGHQNYDYVIHAAAVSDYSVDSVPGKISSDEEVLELKLRRNPKLIQHLAEWSKNKDLQIIGFKLTSTDSNRDRFMDVKKLMSHAGVTHVVHNDMAEIKSGHHQFRLFGKDSESFESGLSSQNLEELASSIGQIIINKGVSK